MADLGKIVPTEAGSWNSATSYERLTFVKHNGATYLSTADSQGQEPSKESPFWMFLVEEIVVDKALSDTSENAISNKAVKEAIDAKGAPVLIQETTPSDTSALWVW